MEENIEYIDFFDGENYAAIVAGQRLSLAFSGEQLQELNRKILALAEQLDTPLVLLSPILMNEQIEGLAVAGQLIAHARGEQRPVTINKTQLAAASSAVMPAALVAVLSDLPPGITPDKEGVFLSPGGWSSASLTLGTIEDDEDWDPDDEEWEGEVEGDDLAMCSSEDTTPIILLTNVQQFIEDDGDEKLILSADYC